MEHEEIQSVNGDTPRVTIQEGDPKHEQLLGDAHLDQLIHGSGIDLDVITERGYRTVTKQVELMKLGFSSAQSRCSKESPALLIPAYNVTGDIATYMLRPDTPRIDKDGKALKYEFPKGSTMVLDVHPRIRLDLQDPNIPLFITEGIKKADTLISHDQCAIDVLGTWAFRGTNKQGGKAMLPDWEYIPINNREVYIVYDSDVSLKLSVHMALVRLGQALKVKSPPPLINYIYIPPGEDGSKVGADDYLVQGFTIDDLLKFAHSTTCSPWVEPNIFEILAPGVCTSTGTEMAYLLSSTTKSTGSWLTAAVVTAS